MSVHMLQEPTLAGQSPENPILPQIGTSALSTCLDTISAWIIRSGQRRALRDLAEEARQLSDVGLTREQALREAGKPFWQP
jgi:uncharacterized protein YjiS (DUF1127 family)